MMRHERQIGIALLLGLLLALTGALSQAQASSGQVCVRAFQDRNANAQLDGGEPVITRGLSAALKVDGIIVDTLLMDDSPTRAQGILCFQRLEPGQYSVTIRSADYTSTTDSEFVTAVSATGLPQTFDYGGQIVTVTAPVAEASPDDLSLTPEEQRRLIARLTVAGIGAALVIGLMAVIGAVIYFFLARGNRQPQYATGAYPPVDPRAGMPPADPRSSTGNMPVVPPNLSTGDMPMIQEPPLADDDTGKSSALPASGDAAKPSRAYLDDDESTDAPFRPPQE